MADAAAVAPTSTDDWLPILAKNLDARSSKVKVNRRYCEGDAPLPEMGKNTKESWKMFQKKARVNWGGLAVTALKRRIRPRGVKVGDGSDAAAAAAADLIWRNNRLRSQLGMAVRDRLETSVGYIAVGKASDGHAVVTRERPELFIASTDPLIPWRARAALKVWRDEDLGKDYALVWIPGSRQRYVRDSKKDGAARRTAVGDWLADGEAESYDGDPPIVVLQRPEGRGLVEEHHDLIDQINAGKLQRLVTTAMQAFKQRALRPKDGSTEGLPQKDDQGNDIDWSKILEAAPGAIWDLPVPIDIWESKETDIRPLLEGEKSDIRTFSAATSTPLSVFIPEGQNQSAEGAANAKEGHLAQAEDEIDDIAPGLAMVMVYALRVEGIDLGDRTVSIDFAPPALVSLQEKYAAAASAKASGMPFKTILRDVLGMDADQIKQTLADRLDEMLEAVTLGVPPSWATGAAASSTVAGGPGGQQPAA